MKLPNIFIAEPNEYLCSFTRPGADYPYAYNICSYSELFDYVDYSNYFMREKPDGRWKVTSNTGFVEYCASRKEALFLILEEQSDAETHTYALISDILKSKIDPELFNWKEHSWAVAEHCPEHFDPELYNWEDFSDDVLEYCPEHFDAEKYNWKDYSRAVAMHSPKHFDPEKYNWDDEVAVDEFFESLAKIPTSELEKIRGWKNDVSDRLKKAEARMI